MCSNLPAFIPLFPFNCFPDYFFFPVWTQRIPWHFISHSQYSCIPLKIWIFFNTSLWVPMLWPGHSMENPSNPCHCGSFQKNKCPKGEKIHWSTEFPLIVGWHSFSFIKLYFQCRVKSLLAEGWVVVGWCFLVYKGLGVIPPRCSRGVKNQRNELTTFKELLLPSFERTDIQGLCHPPHPTADLILFVDTHWSDINK